MVVIVEGTLTLGWPSDVGAALASLGYDVAVHDDASDPFALLLYRAEQIRRNPDCVVVCSRADVERHPQIDALVGDLSSAFVPGDAARHRIVLDAEPHEFFAKCVAEGMDARKGEIRDHLGGKVLKRLCVPAYMVDTPGLLRKFLQDGLSGGPCAVRADVEQADGHG